MGLRRHIDGTCRTKEQIDEQETLKEHCSMLLFAAMKYNNHESIRNELAIACGRSRTNVEMALHGSGDMKLSEISDMFLALGYRVRIAAFDIKTGETIKDERP